MSPKASADLAEDGANKPLVEALRRLLRPLVRLLISRGVGFPFLAALLKRIYVDVAHSEFQEPGKAPTVSRVSLLTGVHRKDVRAFLDEGSGDSEVPRAISLGARLVSTWTNSRRYLDREGRPKSLPRAGRDGRRVTFDDLVEEVHRGDVRPKAVLEELERLGVVRVDEDDTVHLDTEALVPQGAFEETAWYFGRNLRDHIGASAHNLLGQEPSFPERAAYHDGLSSESVEALRALASERGTAFLQDLLREASRLAARDLRRGAGDRRVTIGMYYFSDSED